MRIFLTLVFLSSSLFGMDGLDDYLNEDKVTRLPEVPSVDSYYDHEDIYTEILDWEAESGVALDQNIRICIEEDCQIFFHKEEGNYNYSTINMKRTRKKPGGSSAVKEVLKAVGSGVSAGGKVKISKIRINADGSMELTNVEISGGFGVGADAPVPGYEDGKQVHNK